MKRDRLIPACLMNILECLRRCQRNISFILLIYFKIYYDFYNSNSKNIQAKVGFLNRHLGSKMFQCSIKIDNNIYVKKKNI